MNDPSILTQPATRRGSALHRFANPGQFLRLAGALQPYLTGIALVLTLTGLVARADGTFLLRRTLAGASADAARIGEDLGASLRADSPADLFA